MRVDVRQNRILKAGGIVTAAFAATVSLSSCQVGDVIQNGYVVDEQTLALAPVGSSREQVMLSLGSPSATATFDTEVFYYISQKRTRMAAFMKPKLVEQNILAVYFNKDGEVDRLANYKLEDGRVVDMLSKTTPTGGTEMTFLLRLLKGGLNPTQAAQSALGTRRF
ncbi:MAG: outer membrane protein assembly factor BamE [Rhizobiaceae bacterium]|nr:outer membrane protein assembly factor BamE [Rhizobiaceae bacterium]